MTKTKYPKGQVRRCGCDTEGCANCYLDKREELLEDMIQTLNWVLGCHQYHQLEWASTFREFHFTQVEED